MTEYSKNVEDNSIFWSKKPVTQINKIVSTTSKICDLDKISLYNSETPISISQLEWESIDLEDFCKLSQVCDFLNLHYDKDQSSTFSYFFTPDILKFFIQNGECLVLQFEDNILGTISYTKQNLVINNKNEDFINVNFLCIHPKYRNQGTQKMVHLLIDEVTRKCVNNKYNSGIFTTNKKVARPISAIRYYNRPLNYNKLHKHNFISIDSDNNSNNLHKRFLENVDPPDHYINVTSEDIKNNNYMEEIHKLYNEYMSRYNLYVNYSKEELEKILFNDNVDVYILKNKNNKIVDFLSYFNYTKAIKDSDEQINISHLYLYTCLTEDIQLLISNFIRTVSKNNNTDLITITDNMQNSEALLSELKHFDIDSDNDDYEKVYDYKFGKSPIKSYINLFNWQCPQMKPNQICFQSIF